jgi:hypothetical protein
MGNGCFEVEIILYREFSINVCFEIYDAILKNGYDALRYIEDSLRII